MRLPLVITLCSRRLLGWFLVTLTLTVTLGKAYTVSNVVTANEEITCWTCPNKTDNEACNDWAPDLHCPTNHTVCKTMHRINLNSGKSVAVSKVCAVEHDCTSDMIGCHHTSTPGVWDCVSCCNYAYCNEIAPTNHSSAIMLSTLSSSASARIDYHWTLHILPLFVSLLTVTLERASLHWILTSVSSFLGLTRPLMWTSLWTHR